jgi:hypothetical protein
MRKLALVVLATSLLLPLGFRPAGAVICTVGDQGIPVAGELRANNALLLLAGDGSGTVNIYLGSSGSSHFLLDVSGYFQ